MFRYRLHSAGGDDLGEATYAVMIKPGEEIHLRGCADRRETDSNRRHQSERNLYVTGATRTGKVARSERIGGP